MADRNKFLQFFDMIQKHRLPAILLAAFLTLAVLMELVRLPAMTGGESQSIVLTEEKGSYDLTGIADLEDAKVRLIPGSNYYPNFYLTPDNVASAVPEPVENYDGIHALYLSQRFLLKLPDSSDIYTLTFTLSGRHAIRVYINGRLAGQTGKLGTTKKETAVWENNITCNAAAADGRMEILLNSAQFYHIKRGASLAELIVEVSRPGGNGVFSGQIMGLLIMGALLCATAVLLGIYLLLSHTKATLYFALACIAMALRECLQSQAWTYFPISGNLSFQLEYLTMVLLTVFLSLYLGQYVTGRFLRMIQITVLAGSGIYSVCVLFCDSLFYTSVLVYYEILLVVFIIIGITGLFFSMRRPNTEQTAALYGIAVFYLAAVSDIIMYSDIFGDSVNAPVSEAAMLVFALAQTVSLLLMNSRVLAETKEAEQKLEAEKSALENLNRMKSEFLGNVSHELKTPLTVMSGYAQTTRQMVENDALPDGGEVIRRMKIISSEAERLALMVGQILDVTRMEENRMPVNKESCWIEEIICSSIDTHYPILNENGNRLEIRLQKPLPRVHADPMRISQVIVNLIANASRFTVDGLIVVSAEGQENNVVVRVSDNGEGISAEQLPHIFERYNNKEKSGGRNTGTGLGLYICKYIVEQHGGRIWAESKSGKGTRVSFTLPALPFSQEDINNGSC